MNHLKIPMNVENPNSLKMEFNGKLKITHLNREFSLRCIHIFRYEDMYTYIYIYISCMNFVVMFIMAMSLVSAPIE